MSSSMTSSPIRQDGGVFAMGFHLSGIVRRRVPSVSPINAWDTVTDYRNGDGFVAERGTYGLRFEDTQAIVNMDGGYDSKASDVTFVRANAWGNKRNHLGSHVVMDSISAWIRSDPAAAGRSHRWAARRPGSIWDSSSSIATRARSCSTSRRLRSGWPSERSSGITRARPSSASRGPPR